MATILCDLSAVDVAEIYSPPRLTAKSGDYGLRPEFAVDLTTKKRNGEYWDLMKDEDADYLKRLQETERPRLLVGSPPCTDFSTLLHLSRTKEQIEERRQTEGRVHLKRAIDAYWRQFDHGNHFLHEHPKGAASWSEPEMVELAADPRVYKVSGPMCVWEMIAEDKKGKGYVRNGTGWLTS